MPQDYTVRDQHTGRVVTFRWSGDQPPTENDLADVFASTGRAHDADAPGVFTMQNAKRLGTAALPIVGGAVGGMLAGIPGAAAGGALGTVAKAGVEGHLPSPSDLATSAALNAASEGIGSYVVTPAMNAAGRFVASKAAPIVQRAVKPTISLLRLQSGAPAAGLTGQARRVAGILLKNRFTGPEEAATAVKGAEDELQTVLANAGDAVLDTAERVPRYLRKLETSASAQAMPRADVGAIRGANNEILQGPLAGDVTQTVIAPSASGLVDQFGAPAMVPSHETTRVLRTDISPSEGLSIARATGRWGNRKAWGELKGAEQEASKATERAIRDSVKNAVPEAQPILQRQAEALTVLPILDRMALREGNRDAVSLPAYVLAAGAGHPASMVARGAIGNVLRNGQLRLGYGAADLGQGLMQASHGAGRVSADAMRAALISLLTRGNNPSENTEAAQ